MESSQREPMEARGLRFLAIQHRLPTRRVTNKEVIERVREESGDYLAAAELDLLQDLIARCFRSAGTMVRYHRAPGEVASDLAVEAGRAALAQARVDPAEIDLIIYAGIGRGIAEPASATIYQDLLGLRNATAFDVMDACASWLRALEIARLFLVNRIYRRVMILNAEFVGTAAHVYRLRSLSDFAHWHPGLTIGEAATATVVEASTEPDCFDISHRTYGERRDLCFVTLPDFDQHFGKPAPYGLQPAPLQFVSLGLRLTEFGATKLIDHYRSSPHVSGFMPDIVFGHAASDGMSRHVLEQCGIDHTRFQFEHRLFANTASASIPLAMSNALAAHRLRHGQRALLLCVSAGVTTSIARLTFLTECPD